MTPADLDRAEVQLRDAWALSLAPPHQLEGFVLWVVHGIRPGGFACAVLDNDLTDAVLRADDKSSAGLAATVRALRAGAPARSWGSPDRCDAWAAHRGLQGYLQGREAPEKALHPHDGG
jgi:hypothetical protein